MFTSFVFSQPVAVVLAQQKLEARRKINRQVLIVRRKILQNQCLTMRNDNCH
jgi:hypothetical protein